MCHILHIYIYTYSISAAKCRIENRTSNMSFLMPKMLLSFKAMQCAFEETVPLHNMKYHSKKCMKKCNIHFHISVKRSTICLDTSLVYSCNSGHDLEHVFCTKGIRAYRSAMNL